MRLGLVATGASELLRGRVGHARTALAAATRRGPRFSDSLVAILETIPRPFLVALVERATRTDLLPRSELARARAAALLAGRPVPCDTDALVAAVLAPKSLPLPNAAPPIVPAHSDARRFIVAELPGNPYARMITSQLGSAGFAIHYVNGLSGIRTAVAEAQRRGEQPHVHLDSWLTDRDAAALVSMLQPSTTLSVTAHDLEEAPAHPNERSGMRTLVARADAVHLLTPSARNRLGLFATEGDSRFFHVPHPSYRGPHGGSYGLPIDRASAREALERPASERAVGVVGRISDRKNIELLLDAAELLLERHGGATSPRIYVSGSLRTRRAERIVRRAATLRNVVVSGDELDDRSAGLHAAALDAAVVPYHRYLNSGWTVLALTAGLPIIASRESTASEVVPAAALFEYAEGDAASLAAAILDASRRDLAAARRSALAQSDALHPDLVARRYADELTARIVRR